MKNCIRCNIEKPLSDFYKHKGMGDGTLNKCKDCCKSDSIQNYNKKIKDPDFVKKEKKRGRDKYHKYKYKSNSPNRNRNYREKYPEKYKAKNIAGKKVERKINGNHLHHWSYNDEHFTDVIEMKPKNHYFLHSFIIYDQDLKMYRKQSGEILNTKEKHVEYFHELLKTELVNY